VNMLKMMKLKPRRRRINEQWSDELLIVFLLFFLSCNDRKKWPELFIKEFSESLSLSLYSNKSRYEPLLYGVDG